MRHSCDSVVSATWLNQFSHLGESEGGWTNWWYSLVGFDFFLFSIDRENLVFSYKGKKERKKQDGNDTIIASKREGKPSWLDHRIRFGRFSLAREQQRTIQKGNLEILTWSIHGAPFFRLSFGFCCLAVDGEDLQQLCQKRDLFGEEGRQKKEEIHFSLLSSQKC